MSDSLDNDTYLSKSRNIHQVEVSDRFKNYYDDSGLKKPEMDSENNFSESHVEYTYKITGVIDPTMKFRRLIPLQSAIQKGYVDLENGQYCFPKNGIKDARKISIQEAMDDCYIIVEKVKKIC